MPATSEARATIPARQVAAVVIGNALEFYDFLTYAFFAVYIGRAFFPSDVPTASLLASLATFGAGFVTRPVGSLVIGRMGDRAGRRPAMVLSFSLMGLAIVGLALTPPQASIGVAAPILVIFFRMLQGFALGGEVGPTTAFLLEAAPPERRGFYAAFQSWTQDLSVLCAGLV
jgi:MHS family citrate/tricarballylate:H+ symporter-like MFS transporter